MFKPPTVRHSLQSYSVTQCQLYNAQNPVSLRKNRRSFWSTVRGHCRFLLKEKTAKTTLIRTQPAVDNRFVFPARNKNGLFKTVPLKCRQKN
jgi:hypothetical protein